MDNSLSYVCWTRFKYNYSLSDYQLSQVLHEVFCFYSRGGLIVVAIAIEFVNLANYITRAATEPVQESTDFNAIVWKTI